MNQIYKKISDLHGWDKNPRSISKEGLERLKKQIKKLGQYKPLLVTNDGTVLGGNMRLKAYKELDIDNIWVSIVDAPTDEKKIEFALSDNDRVGKYEEDQLADLVGNFPEVEWNDYAVDLKEPELVEEIMNNNKEAVEDEPPAVSKLAVSKLGEVYQLGLHRLMCGDSTKKEDVERLMNGQKADMVFTDPPYGMDLDTDYSNMNGSSQNAKIFAGNKSIGSIHRKTYDKVIGDNKDYNPSHIFRDFDYVKEIFLWGWDYYAELIPDRKQGSWFVWDKRLDETMDKGFGSCFEACWSKQRHKREVIRIKWSGIFGIEKEPEKKRFHPTQKPVELSAWFINKFSEPEQKIIDLFGGSGSTLIACEQTNRICYMMELDPKYCDVIRKRYENFVTQNKEKQL